MVDINVEFTKGILFVRLSGILDEISSYNIEEKVFTIVREGGIRFVVFNTDNLLIRNNVKLFDRCKKLLESNDGKMLMCGNELSAYNFNLEYVEDELSAFKVLNV